jgi:hypothetical protein
MSSFNKTLEFTLSFYKQRKTPFERKSLRCTIHIHVDNLIK